MLEPRQLLALNVLNANDSGPGSLRQAILDADGLASTQATLIFSLPAGPQTINLLSPLPPSTHAIVAQLDATQNVTVVSPASGAQDNLPALTETGAGTLTFDGANNPTGNIQVDSGVLQLNAGDPPAAAPQPFGPVQGVDGDPLAELWPYGGMVANGNAFARGPVLFTTQAGTVLAFDIYQANSQDNTGNNDIFLRRSSDNGKSFGAASIISPPPLPGDAALLASWGGTSWIVASPDLVQRQDGTIYMFYFQSRNGGPQAVAQREYVYRYMTSKDDGQTWSLPTDLTAATIFAGNQNVAAITSVTNVRPGVIQLALTFKTTVGSLPANRSLLKITGLVNDPMGLNGNSYWIADVVSNTMGHTSVIDIGGVPAWQDGTTVGTASMSTPQSVWLGTVGGGEPILRSGRIVIPMYYRYDSGGSGSEPFVGCIYSDDGGKFSQGMLVDETQAAIYGDGGVTSGVLEPHFTELATDNHLYISCNTKGSFHGHMISTDGGKTWTAGLDDGTGGTTMLKVVSTPAPVVALGGGAYVMVMPDNPSARLRLTAFLSTDECATWSKQIPLYSGTAAYSDLALAGGNILCAYEQGHTDTDFNWQGMFSNTIGQIGLVTFNRAALVAGITEQVVYDFNELPAGENAWAGAASIVDYGTGDHRATTTGQPVYTAAPAGNAQTALTFHNGDALLLANQVDPTFDPDYLATDSGDDTLEFGYSIANHGYGVLFGGDSRVGTGTKGITVVVNPNGTVSMTVDDGTHHSSITSTVDATNDGAYHRVVSERDTSTGTLRMWTYRSNGSLTETVAPVTDPTTIAPGSLWNGTEPTYLCRYGDTTVGSMSQNITFDLFRYAKNALPTNQFTPIPSVAPAPEQLPLPAVAMPDTVASSNLKLWLFDSRGGFSMRTGHGSSPTATNPPIGCGSGYYVDGSGHGYYTSFAATPAWRGVDPTVGGYWTVPGSLGPTTLDNSTIGQFDYISRFSSSWTIAGMFRVPAATATATEYLLTNMDGSNHGFSIATNYAGTPRFWFQAGNEKGQFISEVTAPGGSGVYAADTWYYFALVFNGSGGGSTQGLTAYLVPLSGTPLSLSDVAGDKSSDLDSGLITGSTAAAAVGSTAALRTAGGANSQTQIADLSVWNTALTDANILTLANGRVSQPTATVDGTGTLELSGPDSAIAGGNGRANIINTSSAAAGVLVSGTNELLGKIDGTGNTTVSAGGHLTASHIVQNALVIGGTSANRAVVTIAASDSKGNPAVVTTTYSDLAAQSETDAPASSTAAIPGAAASVEAVADPAGRTADSASVAIGLATTVIADEPIFGWTTTTSQDSGSSGQPIQSADSSRPISSSTFSIIDAATNSFENPDSAQPVFMSPQLALDVILEKSDSWLAKIDPILNVLAHALQGGDVA